MLSDTNLELEHYGIKGMKWGVRRSPEELGHITSMKRNISSRDKKVNLVYKDSPAFTKVLGRVIPSVKKQDERSAQFEISDKKGNKVGNFFVEHVSDSELNLNWMDISKKERGKKYAQSAMKAMIDAAKDSGYSVLTLEVPTDSPDARHIYEKLGFKEDKGKIDYDEDDIWGGLTAMKLELNRLQHSSQNELEHYGIKGMKWGVRRTPEQLGYKRLARHTGKKKPTRQERIKSERKKAYANRRTLSDEELRARINRLQLEKQFRELSDQDLHHGREVVKNILGFAGSQTAKTITAGTMLYAAKVGMTKSFSWREAADYITPKPKKK